MMRTMAQGPWGAAIGAAVLCVALWSGCGTESAKKKPPARSAELTVIFSSDLLGKVRSCGCVIEDQGGLGRWATFTGRIRESVDNLVVVDAGDAFGPELSFTQKEAELTFDAMNVVGLDAFTPGETEFVFGLPFLLDVASRAKFPIVAANIVDPATGVGIFGAPYTIKTLKGGLRVAITGVLDDAIRFPAYIDVSKFKVLPAIETIRNLVPELRTKADFLIVLSHMGKERSLELARQVNEFDLVVIGHGKPVVKELEKQGKSIMLATGGSGQYMGRIDLSLSGAGVIEQGQMKLVPLDDSIPLDQQVKDLFVQYGLPLTDKELKKKK
jgi:2',3'-cyclic-nucleotide 2'-phosphodiesterase (5'-nucleotidase family)